jgi:hypothetical protein
VLPKAPLLVTHQEGQSVVMRYIPYDWVAPCGRADVFVLNASLAQRPNESRTIGEILTALATHCSKIQKCCVDE